MLSLLADIPGIFKDITDLVDDLHTSDEERAAAKQKIFNAQATLFTKTLEHEQQILEAKTKIITAEAQGQSVLQRNWRPITMLTFLVLVICDCFGLLAFRLSAEAWTLLQIGLGGYVVGRSAEKIAPTIRDMAGKPK